METQNNVTDELLADVSIRIQLPPSMYEQAIRRYETVADYLERDDSPLKDNVSDIYTQGSIAIGATIRSVSKRGDDIYDVDLISELDSSLGDTPDDFLDILYKAVKGKEGSRYYTNTVRQTRCVTIEYADMHIDITPMIRTSTQHHMIERAGKISHANPDELSGQKFVENNSFGLSKHINERIPETTKFSKMYSERLMKFDRTEILLEKADIQPAPDQQEIAEKSITVVALQLIKRRMQILWADKARQAFRKPPSVILSLLSAENALGSHSLLDETVHLCETIASKFNSDSKVEVINPEYREDILTDRWPESHRISKDQRMLANDLYDLARRLKVISEMSLSQKRAELGELFGEELAKQAYDSFYKRNYMDTKQDSRNVIPKTGAIALAGASVSAKSSIVKPKPTTSWGGICKD
ncbi:MAG: nucleotidyltransferase [Hyphomonadaceae bacterium]|nr:nucleotidyltransferase [Hyphomonadaceae bacterium]